MTYRYTSFQVDRRMFFKSIDDVLGSLESHYQSGNYQQWQQVLRSWSPVVGQVVAAQTRPLSIYRDVLKVATSSPAWAQNLLFERQRILDKLNAQLSKPLSDIRFSAAQWQQSAPSAQSDLQQELWQNHPSQVVLPPRLPRLPHSSPADANIAFRRWATVMQARSRHLPQCPQCGCPTPKGELERWSLCSLCAAKQW